VFLSYRIPWFFIVAQTWQSISFNTFKIFHTVLSAISENCARYSNPLLHLYWPNLTTNVHQYWKQLHKLQYKYRSKFYTQLSAYDVSTAWLGLSKFIALQIYTCFPYLQILCLIIVSSLHAYFIGHTAHEILRLWVMLPINVHYNSCPQLNWLHIWLNISDTYHEDLLLRFDGPYKTKSALSMKKIDKKLVSN